MKIPLFATGELAPFEEPRWTVPSASLHVMLKPPAELAERLTHFSKAASSRAADLLHCPIQPLGERSRITTADLRACRRALAQLRHAPFLLLFDRIEAASSMMLADGDRNCAVQAFRAAVRGSLTGVLGRLPDHKAASQLTVNEHAVIQGCLLAQPVAWRVEEFLLVECSADGSRHVEHGRWPLG